MAQQTKPMSAKTKDSQMQIQMQSSHSRNSNTSNATVQQHSGAATTSTGNEEDEIEEIELNKSATIYDKIYQMAEKFACTRMGQAMIEKSDRVLKVLENTAKWSLPQDDNSTLERPLPWVFFLSLIMTLRVTRIWLSVGAFMIGNEPVTPQALVYFFQTRRRKLRAIRVHGLKHLRRNQETDSTTTSSSGKRVTVVGKMRTLLNRAICKPGQQQGESHGRRMFGSSCKDITEPSGAQSPASKRPRDEDCIDLNLTVDQMLNKYANDDSDDDSDFVPNLDEDNDDSASSTSSDDSSADETEKDASNEKNTSDNKSMHDSIVEVHKGTTMPKPIAEIKKETLSDIDSGTEQTKHTQNRQNKKEALNNNQATAKTGTTNMGAKNQAAVKEVATKNTTPTQTATKNTAPAQTTTKNTNPTQTETKNTAPAQTTTKNTTPTQLLKVAQPEDIQKSTPGHESAAILKPDMPNAITTAEPCLSNNTTATTTTTPCPPCSNCCSKERVKEMDKCYRTITTQTCIELDWSIKLKTEVTRYKPKPKLEKLNCSITLTPASSSEDIFYSPIGSPQDFHSIFHPAPLVKETSTVQAQSTPKTDTEKLNDAHVEENKITVQPIPQQNKQQHNHHHHQHYNPKNRNRNRR